MKTLKTVLACILAAVLLAGMCCCASADELTDSLNQPVPFGVAHMDNGAGIPVYKTMTARTASDQLRDYQACAILDSQTYNRASWYRIRYVSGQSIKEGYIRADGFYPMTVAGLITAASDPAFSAELRTLAADAKANSFTAQATPEPTATPKPTKRITASPSPTPRGSKKATATPAAARKRYVLNTKTMKFHLPSCPDAEKAAAENKKITITTRQSLIDQGYSPCQKCDP